MGSTIHIHANLRMIKCDKSNIKTPFTYKKLADNTKKRKASDVCLSSKENIKLM